jgi:hypothetical protein
MPADIVDTDRLTSDSKRGPREKLARPSAMEEKPGRG